MKRIIASVLLSLSLISFGANAALLDVMTKGSTSRSVVLRVIDSTTGVPNTAQAFNSSGIDLQYCREAAACTAVTEATQTAGGAWSSGGFVHLGFGNYRFDVPDAAFATGVNHVEIVGTITGYIVIGGTVRLTDSSLEAANVTANVIQWTGTNVATPDTAGYVKATIKDGTGTGEIDTNAGAVVSVTTTATATNVTTVNGLAANVLTAASAAADLTTELQAGLATPTNITAGTITTVTNLTNAPTAGDLTATMKTSVTTAATAATPTAAAVTGAVGSVTGAVGSVTGAVGSVTGAVGSIAANGITNASFDTTAGPMYKLQIVDQGTAQAATGTTLQIRSAATFADSELVGATVVITGGSAGVGQARTISANVSTTDTLTVPTWTTTPSGTVTYEIFATPAGAGGAVSISAGGIAASSFAAGAIDATAIAAGAITASKFAAGAIDATAIATGAIGEAEISSAAGSFFPLGIIDQGTAQAATSSTLQLRSAANFANDEVIGATILITGGSTGVGQSRVISDYVSSSDTATVDPVWQTTPTGTVTYAVFGTAPSASTGGVLTQADVRAALGFASANFDTQEAALQADTDNIQTRLPTSLVSGRIDASVGAMAANTMTAAAAASDLTTELQAGLATPTNITAGTITTVTTLTNAPSDTSGTTTLLSRLSATRAGYLDNLSAGAVSTAASVAALPTAATISAQIRTDEQVLTGTCSSGSTTTCVDAALTQAAASQLEGRLICFNDSTCALITTFNPATDTATTTKVAASTRSGKAYTIFPATLQ